MEAMLSKGIYDDSDLQQRLRALFRSVNAIQRQIDEALGHDDMHRRRKNLRILPLPRNFPQPQSMGQCTVHNWIRWIWEESGQIVSK